MIQKENSNKGCMSTLKEGDKGREAGTEGGKKRGVDGIEY